MLGLHFPLVCSPHSSFCTQAAFYSESAVCILPLIRRLHFTLTVSTIAVGDLYQLQPSIRRKPVFEDF